MNKIKEKLIYSNKSILEKDFLEKLVMTFGYTYKMDDLSNLGYISVIKNGKYYYNNQIRTIKNPYIIGATYCDYIDYLFGGFDMYNKYGFTTQVSNIYTIYNLKYSKDIDILGIKYRFKKVKKEFLYGKETKMINYFDINFMIKERCFIEFVRDYINNDDEWFVDSMRTLRLDVLDKLLKKYPLKNILEKITRIRKCI